MRQREREWEQEREKRGIERVETRAGGMEGRREGKEGKRDGFNAIGDNHPLPRSRNVHQKEKKLNIIHDDAPARRY